MFFIQQNDLSVKIICPRDIGSNVILAIIWSLIAILRQSERLFLLALWCKQSINTMQMQGGDALYLDRLLCNAKRETTCNIFIIYFQIPIMVEKLL